jgi:ketosteroid isomerase-like protein
VRTFAVAAVAAVLAGGACARQDNAAGARAAMMRADSAFAEATKARGVDGWLDYFADSGVQVTPGRNVVGRAAIRVLMAGELSDTAHLLSWHPTSAVAARGGDLGYTIGRWEFGPRSGGAPALKGTYVTIWRKESDGRWKVVLDVGNADPPAPKL